MCCWWAVNYVVLTKNSQGFENVTFLSFLFAVAAALKDHNASGK